MKLFRGRVDVPEPTLETLPEEEAAVLEKVANKAVEKGWTVPAILFLESVKPLNFIGSQAMVFFEPIVQSIFNFRDYETFRTALEKRATIEILIQRIEALDSVALAREKRIKKYLKEQRRGWKWYQRWLGIATPRIVFPDEVLNGPKVQPKNDGAGDKSLPAT